MLFLSSADLKNLSEIPSSAKQLDPDQTRQFIGPNLGSNCLQRLSVDNTGRQRVLGLITNGVYLGCDEEKN